MPKLSKDQQEFRRQRILAAAERCFTRSGFHRTTMLDICREAGVSAGALYIYFPSKEALIAGIAGTEQEEILSRFESLRYAPDFLSGMAQVMQACVVEHPVSKAVLFLEIVAESNRNPEVSAILRRVDGKIRSALGALLSRAKADGRLSPLADVDRLVEAMSTIVDGLLMRRVVDPAFDPRGVGALLMQAIRQTAMTGKDSPVVAFTEGLQEALS
jgi:TetR/AcrR family transcriptional repressor of uid operon